MTKKDVVEAEEVEEEKEEEERTCLFQSGICSAPNE